MDTELKTKTPHVNVGRNTIELFYVFRFIFLGATLGGGFNRQFGYIKYHQPKSSKFGAPEKPARYLCNCATAPGVQVGLHVLSTKTFRIPECFFNIF